MRISCIMPSYLGDFPGCAPNRRKDFIRAVGSFLAQKHMDRELVIISDGCFETIQIVKGMWRMELELGRIKLVELDRHEPFTGAVRQAGIDVATGEWLLSLDTDDFMMPHHLTTIACSVNKDLEWVYHDYWIEPYNLKDVRTLYRCDGTIGTLNNGTTVWRKDIGVSWEGCDGRFDNKIFMERLLNFSKYKKIYGSGMIITNVHITAQL